MKICLTKTVRLCTAGSFSAFLLLTSVTSAFIANAAAAQSDIGIAATVNDPATEPVPEPVQAAATTPAQGGPTPTAVAPARPAATTAVQASRESSSRVTYGDITISRPRWDGTSSGTPTPSAPIQSATEVQPAPVVRSASIIVPSNTLGYGESLQVRSERIAAEQREQDARASLIEAEADIARAEAVDAVDRDSVIYFGGRRIVYPGYRYGYGIGGGYGRPLGAASPLRGETSTSIERFKQDEALFNYAEAARPRIGPAIRRSAEAQLRFSEAARPDEIIEIQKGIDLGVKRNRLERVRVPAKPE